MKDTPDKNGQGNKKQNPLKHSLRTLLIVAAILIVYAFGLQITKVDLETPKEAKRQSQLTNIIRGLANPRLVEYPEQRLEIDAPIIMPCNPQVQLPPVDTSGRYIEVIPNCLDLGQEATIKGYNFKPRETVYLFFLPEAPTVQEQIELRLANEPITVQSDGQFTYKVNMRDDRPSDQIQYVRAVVKIRQGLPQPSVTLKETFNKIIETVFLALIATTFGTLLAIPISFLAARNLMENVVSPYANIASSLLVAPFGFASGWLVFRELERLVQFLTDNVGIGAVVALLILSVLGLWLLSRVLRQPYEGRGAGVRQWGIGLGLTVVTVLGMSAFARVAIVVGLYFKGILGPFGFLGNAVFVMGDMIEIVLPLLGGLIGLFLFSSVASSLAERLLRNAPHTLTRIYTIVVGTLGCALLTAILTAGIAWLYEVEHYTIFILVPTVIVAVVIFVLSLFARVDQPVPVGMIVYNVTRTILNTLRSIEPLIMVVAFAVWVGIGPFAGVIALALHTIAGLGKLYSEQVENILTGPVEAVTATGANFLQTIVYAVIPQIVPSYTAFTIYRWDINVRMSTIIGFGGGGGIGFLVQQNLNLLKYRDASVQMIAIAIVVGSLDYVSSRVRDKII